MLIADGVAGRADGRRSTKASTSAHVEAAPPANLHEELWLPHGAPIVGNVARWCRTKDSGTSSRRPRWSSGRCRTPAS